jgi:hypothetical protein
LVAAPVVASDALLLMLPARVCEAQLLRLPAVLLAAVLLLLLQPSNRCCQRRAQLP